MRKAGVAMAALALSCGAAGAEHVVPLFMSASNAQQQGFVRIINHSGSAGTVRIRAVDDTGHEASALTLNLAAGAVAHFNSNDLENGNTDKGLAGSAGAGNGDWALVLETDLDIEALAFVRTSTGFLTSIHGMALTADMTHYIPTFNPGSNRNQQSSLRLINRQSRAAEVSIHGFDDRNRQSPAVSLTVPAGNAISLTAAELEDGPRTASANGALGDGQGKWRLFVESDRPIHAMSLLEDPNGYLTNLSASRKTASELSAIVDGLDFEDGDGDDHGDGRGTATRIALTGSASGRIDPAGDVDWFRFAEVTESGTLTVYTTGSLDTLGRLYDAAGNQLTDNDDGGEDTNFRIERDVDAGTYFVSVEAFDESATGDYTLHTEFESDNGSDDNSWDGDGEVNFVALSYRHLLISSDGIRWRAEDAPRLGSSNRGLGGAYSLRDSTIAYGGGLWVAVSDGIIDVSEDGRNWMRVVDVPNAYTTDSDYVGLNGVAYGNGRWTAVGSKAIITSTDGRSWSTVYGDDWEDDDPNLSAFDADDVAYSNGLWVAGGINDAFESSDGLEWRTVPNGNQLHGCTTNVSAVAGGDGHWYHTRFGSHLRACTRTANGRWRSYIRSSSHGFSRDIEFGDGDFVAVGDTIATWEGGGNSWSHHNISARVVAHRRGMWIVGGAGGGELFFYNRGEPSQGWTELDPGDGIYGIDALAAKP